MVEIQDSGVDDFLEHHGIKGMHWGVRRGGTDSSKPLSPRQQNKALNKASAQKDAAEVIALSKKAKNPIDAARIRTYTGANKQRVSDAKEQYRAQRKEVGSRAAKQILNKVKNDVKTDYAKSQEYKDGYEFAADLLRATMGSDPYGFERQTEIRVNTQRTLDALQKKK